MSKLLLTLRDEDIFPDEMLASIPDSFELRHRAKGIFFDDQDKMALVRTSRSILLPGGGVEEGETLIQAMERECMEEMGCKVVVGEEIGHSDEYRIRHNTKKPARQIIHCFIGHIVGEKGLPQTTQDDELGMTVEWHSLDDAISIIDAQLRSIPLQYYHLSFNTRAQLAFLKEYKDNHAK